jgi:hypothetical protein
MDAALHAQSLDTLIVWRDEAVRGRHEILSGKKAYQVANGGQMRTFNHNNIDQLNVYITELQDAITFKESGRSVGGPVHYGMGFPITPRGGFRW